MMEAVSDNALGVLRKEIRDAMNSATDQMAEGSCESFDSYRYMCGFIYGLAVAERALLDLDKRIREA